MWTAAKKKANDGGVNEHYPPPLATHENIVAQASVFWETLRRFHFLMGTKFMIPVIGGKELDLHILYVEVSRRGGYEKVVAEKKWREVGCVFQFSATTTSASFVLRKHYLSLLYHYEQVHFFGIQGSPSTPTALFPFRGSPTGTPLALVEYSARESVDPRSEGNQSFYAVGTIEAKFDCGYMVTMQIGSQILSGVLYHPHDEEFFVSVSPLSNAVVPVDLKGRPGRRRRNKRGRDPSYPKPNRSGYNFFFAEKHYKLKSLYPHREREFTKIIGKSWTNLPEEERKVYQNIGLKDKERYKKELKEYYEKHKHNIEVEHQVE